jgi:hypothetical protein
MVKIPISLNRSHASTPAGSPAEKKANAAAATANAPVAFDESADDSDSLDSMWVDPLTGEAVDSNSVDELIECYQRAKAMGDRLYSMQVRIRELLASRTEGDAVVRRVRGDKHSAKVTMPDEQFEQALLKEVWNSHQEIASEFLSIERLRVKKTEYRKLINTTGTDAFNFVRDTITKSCRGRVGTPSISIEK